ncbi:MAG: Na-K-Cl cotransporter, partial [Rhodothermales bacterium]
ANIREYLARRGVQGLVRVISAPTPFIGAERLVEAYGLGALAPNTVLLGDTREREHRGPYCRMVTHFFQSRRNVIIVRDDESLGYGLRQRIDVWWGGLKGNGGLMMILAYLLQSSLAWRGVEVRLCMVVPSETAAQDAQANLSSIVHHIRTDFIPEVLVARGRPFDEILRETSKDADLVLMGMAEPNDDFEAYYEQLRERTQGLPSTVFVLAAEEIAFREVLLQRDGVTGE